MVRALADAAQHIHDRGFVHRDIKPANVAFSADGEAVLFDFGIARARNSSDPLDHAAIAFGSPGYTAPELLQSEVADPRGDVWALGVLLLELCTGISPTAPNGRPHSCRAACGQDLGRALDRIVSRAVAVDPDHRFRTAATFANALATLTSARGESPGVAAHTRANSRWVERTSA